MVETLSAVLGGSTIITNISTIYTGVGFFIGLLTLWGLMTKNINGKINSKADKKETEMRFGNIEKSQLDSKGDYARLMNMQQDTNDKVTEIWQFLAKKQ